MADGYIALAAIVVIITFVLYFQAHKREKKEKEENKFEEKKEEYSQSVKKKNRFFNLQNVGWVGFAIVMFLLLSRDNDKRVYSINELGLTAETLVLDNDFQISVLDIVEDYCWVILNENHHSGYGRKIQCYR